jgi:hypothetical protein
MAPSIATSSQGRRQELGVGCPSADADGVTRVRQRVPNAMALKSDDLAVYQQLEMVGRPTEPCITRSSGLNAVLTWAFALRERAERAELSALECPPGALSSWLARVARRKARPSLIVAHHLSPCGVSSWLAGVFTVLSA